MSLKVTSELPAWNYNVKPGWTFFTFTDKSFITKGICWFQKWDQIGDIRVSHTGIVGRELFMGWESSAPKGVQKCDLQAYFMNPNVHIFFREPRLWTPEVGEMTVRAAELREGHKYGYKLIAAHAMTNILPGAFLNLATFGFYERAVCKLLDDPNQEICSEYVAICMKEQKVYDKRGVLVRSANRIKPQDLFEDQITYKPLTKAA